MNGLTVQEVYALTSLISGRDDLTLQQLSNSFRKSFVGKMEILRAGLGIVSLLMEADLTPSPVHRLISIFLLHDCFAHEGQPQHYGGNTGSGNGPVTNATDNPFLNVLLSLLKSENDNTKRLDDFVGSLPSLSAEEKNFLVALLLGSARELWSKTPTQILADDTLLRLHSTASIPALESAVLELQSRFPMCAKNAAPKIIRIPDKEADKNLAYSEQQAMLSSCVSLLDGPAYTRTLPPSFFRLAPPLHVGENEYFFLHSVEASRFKVEYIRAPDKQQQHQEESSVDVPDSSSSAVASSLTTTAKDDEEKGNVGGDDSGDYQQQQQQQQLQEELSAASDSDLETMEKSLKGPLPTADMHRLIGAIKKDTSIVRRVNMSPDKLPKLVEDNPMVAVEVLFTLINTSEISAYFEALVNMELSVHGMEVVNRLTSIVDVPEEFLNYYVSHCIRSCEEIKNNPSVQNRLVRMVCVFLSFLIRNRLINVADLYIELQAFCVNFNSVKEAAALFQTVQMVVNEKSEPNPSDESEK